MQWMPYWWRVQWIYLAYRCTLSFYFLVWLAYSIYSSWFQGKLEQHFSFLANWSFLLWNAYLFISAINVSVNQLRQYCSQKKSCEDRQLSKRSCRRICCTCGKDRSTLCDKISWLFFTVSTEVAVIVTLLYWMILSGGDDDDTRGSALNLHIHLLNGITAVLDLWVTGFPVHIFHFLYTFLYAACYIAFTGVHYATNTTGSSEGNEYIYPVLDYGSKPSLAVGVVLGVMLGLLPLIHILFISQYLVRVWIIARLHKRFETYRKFLPVVQETETDLNNDNEGMSEAGTSRMTFSTTADNHCDV